MTELEKAVAWLEFMQESGYETEAEQQHCRALLDALRWVPCSERLPTDDDADEKGNVLCYWTDEAIETFQARWVEDWNSDRNHKDKIAHWRPLPPKPEGSE